MDEIFNWIAAHFQNEVGVITKAPGLFALACFAVGVLTFFLVRAFFSERLETQGARINFLGEQLQEYKSKLSGASPDQAAAQIASLRDELSSHRTEVKMLTDAYRYISEQRSLTPDQIEVICSGLANYPEDAKQHLSVCSISDIEAVIYGQQILAALKQAGLCVAQQFLTPMYISEADEVGVLVVVNDLTNIPAHAVMIFDTLKKASVDVRYDQFDSKTFGDMVSVLISGKPPMRLKSPPA